MEAQSRGDRHRECSMVLGRQAELTFLYEIKARNCKRRCSPPMAQPQKRR